MSKAGEIEIYVTYPYPCWCEVIYNGEKKFTLHHKELSDLKYAVERAMLEARLKLKKNANEV